MPEWDKTTIYFISPTISCPSCGTKYNTLELLSFFVIPDMVLYCLHCSQFKFTRDYVGKFVGAIKDVSLENR